jgi:hypothetical protein
MKTIKYVLSLALVFFIGCTDDDDLSFVNSVTAPSNVQAQFLLTQDNTGLVTITPNSEGGVSYDISLGDDIAEPVTVAQGDHIEHIYAEGTYTIGIEATGITGLKTEVTQNLVVSFRAPENLVITAEIDPANPFLVNVSASADFAASFLVYFDTSDPDEEGTPLTLDGTVSFEYPAVGDYTIKVVALSGGAETSELTQVVTVSSPVELPIDFEIFDASVFQGFGGASNSVIDNPDTNGNESATVGQIVKDADQVWAGNVITLSAPIDFSEKKVIKMDLWSPRPGGKVLLKVENLDDPGVFFETEVTTVGNSAWEEVYFDLNAIDTGNTYQKIVLFFDFGTVGDGSSDWTFYIDNIKQVTSASGAFEKLLVEDFEGMAPPSIGAFGNAGAGVITLDDLPAGLGSVTDGVGKFDKVTGSETWAGLFFDVPTLDLDTYSLLRIKIWSPKIGAVLKFKIENADASITDEVDLSTTVAGAWEELVYDFSGAPAADYTKIVLFFDWDVPGDDSVYYFDDIELRNTGTPPTVFADFEGTAPSIGAFGNAGAGVITLDDLPAGIDSVTDGVGKFDKVSGSETWAGLFFDVPTLDLDTYSSISIKTWSPKVGAVLKFKIENADASITDEVDLSTTVAGAWEELVYDFSSAPAADYTKIVLFFDWDVAGDDSVYYFDDLTLTD